MSAADDLLIASQAKNYPPARSADASLNEENIELARDSAWLAWMSELLSSTRVLALISVDASGSSRVITQTPGSANLPRMALLLAARAASQSSRQRMQLPETDELLLALPIDPSSGDDASSKVLLLLCKALSRQQQGSLLGLANWALKSNRWMSAELPASLPSRLGNTEALAEPMSMVQLMNQLGRQYPGALCALHWMRRRRLSRVMAVSGQSNVDRSADLVRCMADMANAACTTGKLIPVFLQPQIDASVDLDQSRTLSGSSEPSTWSSSFLVPIKVGGELLLVSMHWHEEPSLPLAKRAGLIDELVPAVQSAWLQHERGLSAPRLLWRRSRVWSRRLREGGKRRYLHGALAVLVLGFLLLPVERRISADIVVEAAERHALVAPVDGYVKSAQARAGDRVAKGDLLASLDNDDLLRQAEKWTAEEQKNQQDYLSALALHDRVELSSLRENRILIRTELDQVSAQLARHELRAPVNGIVLHDAVEDALGSAVKAGKILFEVGSAEQHRLALHVPERSISSIEPGQLLTLRMTADPKRRREARVDTIIPVATASQGQNTFKVYASPLQTNDTLRPGMQGVGKILVGREPRLQQWCTSLWARCLWLAWKLGLVA